MKIPDYNKKIKHPTYLKMQEEIERLKEEYVMLQNASDEVEEEKDREIERLNNDIKEIRELLEYKNDKIERLHSIIKEVREYIKENMSYIEKGKLEYIPSGEDILKILDKAINNKQVMPVEELEEYEPKNIAEQEYQDWFWD